MTTLMATHSGVLVPVQVDASTVELLAGRSLVVGSHGYVQIFWRGTTRLLHRVITDAPAGTFVDHINRDRMDCRLANLRVTTQSVNSINREYPRAERLPRNVHRERSGRFSARVTRNRVQEHLGTFDTMAAAAYAVAVASWEN